MATQQQMMPDMQKITTLSGRVFELPRPWIGFWRRFNEFQAMAALVEEQSLSTGRIPEEFLDGYVDFLETWLRRRYPEISRQEIEETFDTADIPALMQIVNRYCAEVQSVSPPPPAPTDRGSRRR